MIGIDRLASYICGRYKAEYGVDIDEMKLHKLLYFTQRECILQTGNPITTGCFEAWKYGPVSPWIHDMYKRGLLDEPVPDLDVIEYKSVFDTVFEQYAPKPSWSLSTLSHGELSWRQARQGVPFDRNSSNILRLEDISKDADRIRLRRYMFK